jgi:hypothetical protein
MIKHKTREQWLNAAAGEILARFTPEFQAQFGNDGMTHLENLHVSTGFPTPGGLTKVIGECWSSKAAEDEKTHHIFINPRLTDLVEVVATLAHEMIAKWARGIDARIGSYPHTKLVPTLQIKKQGTRMLKLEAKDCCGYVVRTSQKWIDEGLPKCPCDNEMQEA